MTEPSAKSTAGLLPIPVAATQKSTNATVTAKKAHKPPAPRLKLLIRRLPPGMTQDELEGALGEEWKVGAGMVDWLQYKAGKVSKDPAKPSRPSRAYLRVVSSDHIALLSEQVRRSSFQDARNTSHDPVLLGPPSVEFSPYAKTPGSRMRKDARQGTIDQDPDFISFLESLTQPLTRPAPVDSAEGNEKKETVVTTPLVQFIKDKKASKAKDSAASKSSKHSREKDSKQEKTSVFKVLERPRKGGATTSTSEKKTKGEKGSKETAKTTKQAAAATKGGKANASNAAKETTSTAAPERKKERGNAAVATKILQRDPGVSPAAGRRRGKGGSAEAGSSKGESSRDSSAPASAGTKKDSAPKSGKNAGGGGTAKAKDGEPPASKASDAAPPPTKATKSAKAKPSTTPTPTATQAFLKHANPSQGVTEPVLETAFSVFGTVTKVEIDKKKGFAYVDFAAPEGLQKALAASPVSVAQSQVVVLERKANPGGEKSRKPRGDAQPNNGGKAKATEGADAGPGAGPGAGASTAGSSRGSRGGRGSRNKGSKGGAAGGNAGPAEKSAGAETK